MGIFQIYSLGLAPLYSQNIQGQKRKGFRIMGEDMFK